MSQCTIVLRDHCRLRSANGERLWRRRTGGTPGGGSQNRSVRQRTALAPGRKSYPPRIRHTPAVPALPSFTTKPTLAGKLVMLRPVIEGDATALAATDAETLRPTGTHMTFSLDELRAWYRTRADHADRLDLSIIETATGRWIGEVVLNDLDPTNRSCGFRILIASESDYNRGLGREATDLVLAHAFDTVGLHRVELEVYQFN